MKIALAHLSSSLEDERTSYSPSLTPFWATIPAPSPARFLLIKKCTFTWFMIIAITPMHRLPCQSCRSRRRCSFIHPSICWGSIHHSGPLLDVFFGRMIRSCNCRWHSWSFHASWLHQWSDSCQVSYVVDSHWGQWLMHMIFICLKCIWSALNTQHTRWPLTDKGNLCCMLCSPTQEHKVCNKAALCLSKAALWYLF